MNLNIGFKMRSQFTNIEIQFMLDHVSNMTFKEIAMQLNRSVCVVKKKAYSLGIRRNTHHEFTHYEDKFIIEKYPNMRAEDIALALGVTISSVYNRAFNLKVQKSKDFMKRYGHLVSQHRSSIEKRFKKGNVPGNKGKSQVEYMSPQAIEKTKATRFKKGNKPSNTKYNGYERINVDGYIEVRVSERKFVQKHRIIWEQHNGKIPAGTNIQFKDGNRQNCAIENLYAITRSDQIRENSIANYPPEARKVIRKIAKIKNILDKENDEKTN